MIVRWGRGLTSCALVLLYKLERVVCGITRNFGRRILYRFLSMYNHIPLSCRHTFARAGTYNLRVASRGFPIGNPIYLEKSAQLRRFGDDLASSQEGMTNGECRDYGGGVGISAGAGRGERSVTHCTGPLASSDFSCEGGIRLWVTYILYLRAILS